MKLNEVLQMNTPPSDPSDFTVKIGGQTVHCTYDGKFYRAGVRRASTKQGLIDLLKKMSDKKNVSESVSQEEMQRFQQWQRECRAESPNCQFAGSVGMGAQAVDWTTIDNRAIGDWDANTMQGQVYKAADGIGARAAQYINDTFYVYDEMTVGPNKYDCKIEEAKARYRITVSDRGIWVDAEQDTGASPRRARTIRDKLTRKLLNK